MKIAIVVQGRFHAFDLVRELIQSGQDVYVFTNYPKNIAARFGIPQERIRNNLLHGIMSRAANKLGELFGHPIFEPLIHRWFSRWAAGALKAEEFAVVHSFSGVCEEVFRAPRPNPVLRTLTRGSAHIEEQYEILCAEEKRTGNKTYMPSDWMRRREAREYQLADLIFVLSQFAFDSFVRRGVKRNKVRLLSLGTQSSLFRPDSDKIRQRLERIRKGEPLRVLNAGTFSLRKGAFDLVEIARQTQDFARFRFVGAVLPRAAGLANQASALIEFVPKVSQFDLPQHYDWGDIFLFPTLEDGYAVVLAQAVAAGLPIFATTNCAAPELVRQGENGWVFPIRRADLFIDKLKWCNTHREELATMVEMTYNHYMLRDWSDVAQDFVDICAEASEETNRRQIDVARA